MAEVGLYLLASVIGAGMLFKTQHDQRDSLPPRLTTKQEETIGNNIYHSTDFYKVQQEDAKRAVAHSEAAKDISSGIVPMYYNTLNTKASTDLTPNMNYDPNMIFDVIHGLDPAATEIIKKKAGMIIPDFARSAEGTPNWAVTTDRPIDMTAPVPDAMSQIGGSLTGEASPDFTHNNMVPFYRRNITQNVEADNRMKGGALELYTGQFKLNRPQKQETPLFFQPVKDLTNVYGAQEQRDLSRYIPSALGKKNNDAPMAQVQVGPGLNKGFTAEPTGGFHEMLRVMPVPKERLRVDAVVESKGRVKAGKSLNDKRGIIGQQYKMRPDLLVENKHGERNFKTVGAVTGRTLRPKIVVRDTGRMQSRELKNGAKAVQISARAVDPEVKTTRRRNFDGDPFRNVAATNQQGGGVDDFGKKSYNARTNARTITGQRSVLNNLFGGFFKRQIGLQDNVRKTRKQHYIHNSKVFGNKTIAAPPKQPAFYPEEWKFRKTIRETTEDNKYIAPADSRAKLPKSHTNAKNMRVNTIKEKISRGRRPTNRGPTFQIGAGQAPEQQSRKLDTDRMSRWTAVKGSTIGNMYNPDTRCKVTSDKNIYLPINDHRLDISILDAFKRNPLTQPLDSAP
jgi:hypothetical protein